MSYHFHTLIIQEGKYFIARCVEFGVVSQGESVEAAENNLKEAVALYLEDKPREEISQYAARRSFVGSMEFEYV